MGLLYFSSCANMLILYLRIFLANLILELQEVGLNREPAFARDSGSRRCETQPLASMLGSGTFEYNISSDEEDLTGMELEVENGNDEDMFADLAADLDDMVNRMDLPELAEIDLDILNPENLVSNYPGIKPYIDRE